MLAAEEAAAALDRDAFGVDSLAGYARRRAHVLDGKIRLLKVVTALALRAGIAPRLVRRLRQEPAAARMLLGATGDVLPPGSVISLPYLIRLLTGANAHDA
jgi:hypothetical protein